MFTVSGFVCFSNSAYVCAQSGVSFPGYGFVQVMHLENFKTFFFLCSLGRFSPYLTWEYKGPNIRIEVRLKAKNVFAL